MASMVDRAPEGLNVETGVVADLQQVQRLHWGVDHLQLVREEGPPDFKKKKIKKKYKMIKKRENIKLYLLNRMKKRNVI